MICHDHLVCHDPVLLVRVGKFSHPKQGMGDEQNGDDGDGKKNGNRISMAGIREKRQLQHSGYKTKSCFSKNDAAVKEQVHIYKQTQDQACCALGKIKPCRQPALFFI